MMNSGEWIVETAGHSQLSTLNSPFKQTEVGVIPEDWEVQTGEQITTLIGKGASPRWQGFEYTNSGMLFITSENVREGFLDISDPKYLPLTFHEKLKRTKLQRDDILINLVGASIGRSGLIRRELGTANINQAVAVFRVKEKHCPSYIAYYFQAPSTVDRILDMQVDAARPNISLGDLRRFSIPLPTKAEQEAIAEALSDADALIESLEQLIAKKRQIKQGAMQELLTGKKRLPGFETKPGYKQTEGGVIPEDWEAKSLGSIAMIATGNTPPTRNVANYGDEFLFVSPVDLGSSKYISRTEKMLSQKGFSISRPFPKGSILFVCIGSTIGKCGIASETLTSNQQINAILPSADLSSEYLYYAVSAVAPKVKSLAGEQAVPIVNKTQFSETVILLPSAKAEQTAIAAVLSDMDAEITALEEKLTKARQLKQGMMQELLTGKTRLVNSGKWKVENEK